MHNQFSTLVEAGRAKVRKFSGPNSVYVVDHFSDCNEKCFTRIVLNASEEGGFDAKKLMVKLHYMTPFVQESTLGNFKYRHLAMGRIDEEITCLEQSGYLFIDEFTKDQINVKAAVEEMNESRLRCFKLTEFLQRYRNADALVQLVNSGMHVLLLVDEWGKVWYRPTGFSSNLPWFDATGSHIEVVLKGLGSIDGAVGFVGEGFFDGCHLTVSDVALVGNAWVHNLGAKERLETFQAMIKSLEIVKPSIAAYEKVKACEVAGLCHQNRSLIVSVSKAAPSLCSGQTVQIFRALVTEHESFVAMFGHRKTSEHSEIFDYSDLSSKGLAFHNLTLDLNGLTFTACNFRPGEKKCALFC
jgi:hypothetical protein